MTERELIDIINADVQSRCKVLDARDIARRALEQSGEDVFEAKAVTDLVGQVLSATPWSQTQAERLDWFAVGFNEVCCEKVSCASHPSRA